MSRAVPAGREPLTPPAPRPASPAYRPFALLALGTALGAGVPLGVWMLTRLYWGGGQVPPPWLLLHAHLQIFGLFGVLERFANVLGPAAFSLTIAWTGNTRAGMLPLIAFFAVGAWLLSRVDVEAGRRLALERTPPSP